MISLDKVVLEIFHFQILTLAGTVHSVLENGDVRVQFQNRTWTINQASLTKVAQHSKGDVVKVIDDMSTVYSLQEGHGGWVDDMALVSTCIISVLYIYMYIKKYVLCRHLVKLVGLLMSSLLAIPEYLSMVVFGPSIP